MCSAFRCAEHDVHTINCATTLGISYPQEIIYKLHVKHNSVHIKLTCKLINKTQTMLKYKHVIVSTKHDCNCST